ncbi:MAG: sigma-54 dependent transcriptional regulator [Holophagales bacterium]|nr:sigma-54 dependent transcriptional regulator [Holophagales bacterium]
MTPTETARDARGADPWKEHLQTETRTSNGVAVADPEISVPAFTITWHPNPSRVGERRLLPELDAGQPVELSRLEPLFPSEAGSSGRPLADPRISRSPIRIRSQPDGSLVLRPTSSRSRLELDGRPVSGAVRLGARDLENGATLTLARRVVLLLHRSLPVSHQPPSEELVGASPTMVRLYRQMAKACGLEVPVLIRGESGTGKELVASALHAASRRHRAPYLAINLGAVPPSLAASELFGASRGAYSGADKQRDGFFQRADGGTLFLDEVGEAPPEVQVLLLRVLENGEVQPVGAGKPSKVDVRVLAATDTDLERAAREGRFRVPLLHRLAGYELTIPPLRQRRDDVGRLLLHFLRRELTEAGEAQKLEDPGPHGNPWLPAELVARLARFSWPGNVRQLRNVVRRLVVAGRGEPVVIADPELLALLDSELGATEPKLRAPARGKPTGPDDPSPGDPSRDDPTLDHAAPARAYRDPSEVTDGELVAALEAHAWQPKGAARALGISRSSIYVLIERCDQVRKASELTGEEIEAARVEHGGGLDKMAGSLRVSKQGLKRRMSRLGLL